MWAKKAFFRLVFISLAGLTFGLMAFLLIQTGLVHAASATPLPTPHGPDRFTTMSVNYTQYKWWMVDWKKNAIHCAFWVPHDDLPYDDEVASACGQDLYKDWKANSSPCTETEITKCKGYYLVKVTSKQSKKTVSVILPPPEVWISLDDCQPDPDGWCTGDATLVLSGVEPLPNESITGIQGFVGSDPFTCGGQTCKFKLQETDPQGVRLKFWAYSTYGDSSDVFTALLRVVSDKKDPGRLTSRLFVDVLSTQWTGQPAASCAETWEAFPPPDGLPEWLTTPASSDGLQSNIPYAYLAGNLISQGVVDVSGCPDGGLLPGGAASSCGLKASQPVVEEWQNRFDALIFQVAHDNQFPAQLLKNLFSRESQFWPGVFRNSKDVGLGQLTDGGADTALLWNPSFYSQFCPLVLTKHVCTTKGYSNLRPSQQALLRGALVRSVDASCKTCPLGLDLSRADFSVGVFAHTLLANCEQAGKIVQDVTGDAPGRTVSYEDMWRLTLVNYNAGPGCLSDAVQSTSDSGEDLTWDNISSMLGQETACEGAVSYVNDISQIAGQAEATVTPTPEDTQIPTDLTPTPPGG